MRGKRTEGGLLVNYKHRTETKRKQPHGEILAKSDTVRTSFIYAALRISWPNVTQSGDERQTG